MAKTISRRNFLRGATAGVMGVVLSGMLGEAAGVSAEERETITVTLGRQTLENTSLFDGGTYEDNAYIRWAEDALNIDLVDEFEASGDDYDRQVSLALSAGDLPDIMKVGSLDEVKELYENELIADLSDVYEEYISDVVRDKYDSYEGRALNKVTIDGGMYALPGTNSDSGPSEVWVRQDWIDSLGIEFDVDGDKCITIDELKQLAITFMEENPENVENFVGIAFVTWLTSGDSDGTYTMNSIAYALGAYPQKWLQDENGNVYYGSTTDEMKEALQIVADWFAEGIVDPQLGTRTWDDITSLLANGQTGITFGTWHIPDWLLNNVYALNPEAKFEAYVVVDENGVANCTHNDATSGYMVVNKDFEYPEIAVQILNLFYDELDNNTDELEENYPEVVEYVENGVDGSFRPFNIEIGSADSLLEDFAEIKAGVNGEMDASEASSLSTQSIINSIISYMEDPDAADGTAWSYYHSRMCGLGRIDELTENDAFNWVSPVYPETTDTMETKWSNLEKLEEETFIKIATGALDVESGFADFVAEWNSLGGEEIIAEIEEQLAE